MPTSSIRISENVRRALKASDRNISELAREGIESAVIPELVSVCWICGEGIHKKERRGWMDTQRYINDIANGEINQHWPIDYYEHQDLVEFERNNESSHIDPDFYFGRVGKWLNLPDKQPVEFCATCSEYLDAIPDKEISPTDIPIPYQYRVTEEMADVRPRPNVAYAAECMGVYLADYFSHQQSIFSETPAKQDRYQGLCWWTARGRTNKIIGTQYHPWSEIALRCHAQMLRRGEPLLDIYSKCLEAANDIGSDWRPGTGGSPPGPHYHTDNSSRNEQCVACGTTRITDPYTDDGLEYCDACLFSYVRCDQTDECEYLHPRLCGDSLTEPEIELHCFNCKSSVSPREEYLNDLKTKYYPIFQELSHLIPTRKQLQ